MKLKRTNLDRLHLLYRKVQDDRLFDPLVYLPSARDWLGNTNLSFIQLVNDGTDGRLNIRLLNK
jgi:hypothetical protein